MFSLGEAVRVTSADKTRAGKGMIAMVNGDSTFDIIYSTSKLENDEEPAVHSDRIKQLLKEEVDESNDAEIWKNIGNSVFALKDYDAAIAYYKRALALLTSTNGDKVSIGQGVIVSYNDSLDCQTGIISDINDGVADVMFDDSDQEEETEIPLKRLTPLVSGLKNILLQRSIYMNLARSVLKQEQKGWAIKYSSFALAVSHHLETLLNNNEANENDAKITESELNKYLADGYYFRGKALLQACRPKFATQDCKCLRRYDISKATALDTEIQTFKKNIAKSNRKLARDIASWVSTAMSAEGKKGVNNNGKGGNNGDDDLGVLGEDEGEEEEEEQEEVETKHQQERQLKAKNRSSAPPKAAFPVSTIIAVAALAVIIYYAFY
eukprot:gene18630-21201_t